MKHFYLVILLIVIFSCKNSTEIEINSNSKETIAKIRLDSVKNETLENWLNYYKTNDSKFTLSNFQLKTKDTLLISAGNIYGSFDDNFNPIYENVLVYSPHKAKYIDFDSYNVSLDDSENILFSVDQEVNLVDLKGKSVKRIAFRTSSEWVEDVFWINEKIIILLENNYNKKPIITHIDFNNKTVTSYEYQSILSFSSKYTILRLQEKQLIKP